MTKPRLRLSLSEPQIQRAVIRHLHMRGLPNAFFFHVGNGGFRKPIEAAIFKGLGVTAGVPDIFIIHDGRCYALELKSEDGRVSDPQAITHERLLRAGAAVAAALCPIRNIRLLIAPIFNVRAQRRVPISAHCLSLLTRLSTWLAQYCQTQY